MESPEISVVVPIYNEQENLPELYRRVKAVLEKDLRVSYEIIFVDDGSGDNSWEIIERFHKENPNSKGIKFSRNFGHQYALKAGIDYSKGDAVVTMDADLQQPPEMVSDFYYKWREGYKVVQAIRKDTKGASIFKKLTSKIFYKTTNFLSDVEINPGASDFRMIDRQVVEELKKIHEDQLFLRGIIPWLGFNEVTIEYVAQTRFAGETKYTEKKMFKFAVDGIMAFSIRPLRLSIFAGLIVSLMAFFYIMYAIIANLIYKITLPGWTSILVSVLFLGGFQLISIGILGEYLGKLFIENKKRGNYIINKTI